MIATFLRGVLLSALAIVGAACLTGRAHAHDWYSSHRYTTPDGAHCCGGQDCKPYPAENVKVTPQGYVLHDGIVVPFKDAHVSQDQFFHRCDWGGRFRCLFVVVGGS